MSTTADTTARVAEAGRFAGLAGRIQGDPASRARPLVLLHGLTFDHAMWNPVMDALPAGRVALALDLPGHGDSPALPSHELGAVTAAVHDAVAAAGLRDPVLVGHSISAGVAGVYADRYGAAGVVNVDSSWRLEPFLDLVHQLAPRLRGDGFPAVWEMFRTSMHLDRVPEVARPLLAAGDDVPAELVLSYWQTMIDSDRHEYLRELDEMLERGRDLPYLMLLGSELDRDERTWLLGRLPQAELIVWPVGHHFPHLDDPRRFAELITAFTAAQPLHK